MQRRVPSAPAYPGDYVISTVRARTPSVVVFEVVADNLQRLHVAMPNARTDAATIDRTIRGALAALYRPPDPVR